MTTLWRLAVALVLLGGIAVEAREFAAEVDDFQCLTSGSKPAGKHFYISHLKQRKLRKALRKTETGKLGKGYPAGTILQLFPFEAMAKRGGAEIIGITGSSCQNCHLRFAADHDSVCEFVVGAEGLGFTEEQIAAFQASDPRCK